MRAVRGPGGRRARRRRHAGSWLATLAGVVVLIPLLLVRGDSGDGGVVAPAVPVHIDEAALAEALESFQARVRARVRGAGVGDAAP